MYSVDSLKLLQYEVKMKTEYAANSVDSFRSLEYEMKLKTECLTDVYC